MVVLMAVETHEFLRIAHPRVQDLPATDSFTRKRPSSVIGEKCGLTEGVGQIRRSKVGHTGWTKPQVESISHAAKLVGIERIRLWASLLMFTKMEDKRRELMITAIVRGAMCERLGASAKKARKETFFTVGLLSVLDALLDCSMEEALEQLPLVEEIRNALLRGEGAAGEALACVLAYERSQWDAVKYKDLGSMTIRGHYLDSLGWARRISEGLKI